MKKFAAISLMLLSLTGCGTANQLTSAPSQVASRPAVAQANGQLTCQATQTYGSFGTFTILAIKGRTTVKGYTNLTLSLAATASSATKGRFTGTAGFSGGPGEYVTPDQLKVGSVIKAFADYTCVKNNTILPQATPYQLNMVTLATAH